MPKIEQGHHEFWQGIYQNFISRVLGRHGFVQIETAYQEWDVAEGVRGVVSQKQYKEYVFRNWFFCFYWFGWTHWRPERTSIEVTSGPYWRKWQMTRTLTMKCAQELIKIKLISRSGDQFIFLDYAELVMQNCAHMRHFLNCWLVVSAPLIKYIYDIVWKFDYLIWLLPRQLS